MRNRRFAPLHKCMKAFTTRLNTSERRVGPPRRGSVARATIASPSSLSSAEIVYDEQLLAKKQSILVVCQQWRYQYSLVQSKSA